MKQLLEDIRKELEAISPKHLLKVPKKYASREEIIAFESRSGLVFPPDLVEFWLNCRYEITTDTQIYKQLGCDSGPTFFMFEEFEYLVAYWEENPVYDANQAFEKVPGEDDLHFNSGILKAKQLGQSWFPLAIDSFDGAICVDLDPGTHGGAGSLIYRMFVGDDKSGSYDAGFASLREILLHYLKQLKERQVEIEDDIVYPLTFF